MAYSAPSISAAGLSVSGFSDIQAFLLQNYQAIYGPIAYTGNDTSDYQEVSNIALAIADCHSAVVLAYNSRSVVTAVGSALDTLVKPLQRLVASASEALLTITGTAGTVIVNGSVRDANGILWNLPANVTIPNSGTINIQAFANQLGVVQAAPNTITQLAFGAVPGWISANNPNAAIPGQSTETDSQLRARWFISVAVSSKTILAGTRASIAAISGVTRYNVFENPTGSADANGTPAHSLTCVVEGGADASIANAIYLNRGIGPLTNGSTPNASGSTSYTVYDSQTNAPFAVGYYRPTYQQIYVSLTVHGLNATFTTAMQQAIVAAIVSYLNSLQIGETVSASVVYSIAQSVSPSLVNPSFSIQSFSIGTSASPTTSADIPLAFYQVAQTATTQITLTTQ